MKLGGPRIQTIATWLDQVLPLYGNLLGNKALSDRLIKFGYDQQKLLGELAWVIKVQKLKEAQLMESGEATEATAIRDKKLAQANV